MPYRLTPAGRQRAASLERRIRRAAYQAVSANGFHGARLSDIATAAGVSPSTVYRFVDGRDELFADVVRAVSERERCVVEEILQREHDDASAVRAATVTFARRALQGRNIARALLAGPGVPEVDRARAQTRRLLVDAFARRLGDRARAVALVGALVALLEDALLSEAAAADDVAERIGELCVAILSTR